MDFRTAANILGDQVTTSDMAQALKMSQHTIRQARLREGAPGYRRPPDGWERVVLELARQRVAELSALIRELDGSRPADKSAQDPSG